MSFISEALADGQIAAACQGAGKTESEMAFDATQESYWDNAAIYQQSFDTANVENGQLEHAPLRLTVCEVEEENTTSSSD